MHSADPLLAEGLGHHRAGRSGAARHCYDTLLARDPGLPTRLHLGGLMAHQGGRYTEAVDAMAQAVALQPQNGGLHHNLGIACASAGKPEWAERCLSRAVELEPASAESLFNLGAIRLRLGYPEHAEAPLRAAVLLMPQAADALALLGLALLRLGQSRVAATALQDARALPHDTAGAQNALGTLAAGLGRDAEAEGHYRAALQILPGDAVIWDNLGNLLRDAGRYEEAERALMEAIRLRPDRADAHSNLGNVLAAAGRPDAADHSYATALALDPFHANTHYNRGNLQLLTGRLTQGWEGFAWRWRRPGHRVPHVLAEPLWDGKPLRDGTLLLYAEQGFGDTIQMARFIPAIAACSRVILQVQPGLLRLMASLPGVAGIYQPGDTLPHFDVQYSLLSLPRVLGITLETIPAEVPYLRADEMAVAGWRARLAGSSERLVGLAWAGNPAYPADSRRSIDPERLALLGGVPGVRFISLQKGLLCQGGRRCPLALDDWTSELNDFADTAALVSVLDLVISVDTAVAHLAGALGKPVWLLNRFDPCWRWLLHRADSPWYPTLQQFRQPRPGDWDATLASVKASLMTISGKVPA